MKNGKLSLKTKIGFGICDIGGNALWTIMAFILMNYLTDQVGMASSLAGIALMIGKIWDAAADPVVGYLSDRTRTRWGKRRPYIFIGAIMVTIALVVVFTNPRITDQTHLFIWALGVLIFLNLSYAVINIPYSALTPELTHDYHERTILNGYRMSFAVVGTFLGAGASQPILGLFRDKVTHANTDLGYTMMAVVFGVVILAVSFTTVFTIRENKELKPQVEKNMLKSYLTAFRNIPFLLILLPWVLYITAMTIVSGTLIYYFKYIYFAETSTTIALVILLGTTILFIPLWVKLAKWIGKKQALSAGMFIVGTMGIIIFFFAHKLGMNFMFIMMIFAGIGLSPTYVLPWAIVPDTIDYDYSRTKQRREGTYYGIWTFTSKIGQAFAALMIGTVLAVTHYVSNQTIQPASAILGIRILFGPVMAFFYFLGAIIVLFYPIDRKMYEKIQRDIKELK